MVAKHWSRRAYLAAAISGAVGGKRAWAGRSRDFCLVIDPGHGGRNRGCRAFGGTIFEKDYALALGQKLRQRLAKVPRLAVHLTRREDKALSTAERVQVAHELQADLVLSIHANASGDHTQSGFESFVLDPERAQARRLVDALVEGVDGRLDPVALRVASHQELIGQRRAREFAQLLRDTQLRAFPGRIDRGVRYGKFDILVECRRPCVLHEIGFLDHRREGQWLLRAESMERVVASLATATRRHLLRLGV